MAFTKYLMRFAIRFVIILRVLDALIFIGFRSIDGLCLIVETIYASFNVRSLLTSFITLICLSIMIVSIVKVKASSMIDLILNYSFLLVQDSILCSFT